MQHAVNIIGKCEGGRDKRRHKQDADGVTIPVAAQSGDKPRLRSLEYNGQVT